MVKQYIPWQVKIAAKIVLKRVPLSYPFWKKLGLFMHGNMEQPAYAFEVFRRHFEKVSGARRDGRCFVCLELGPGDSLFSALIARAFGATSTYLVDISFFARRDLEPYKRMAQFLVDCGFSVPDLNGSQSLEEILNKCGAQYLTSGIDGLRRIPSGSVDFVWSQAVLEHIRRKDFLALVKELRRIQRSDGVGSHRIDLRDHLGGALNNLRFDEQMWESDFFASSGFYTNRIRYAEMLELFRQAGFQVELVHIDRWPDLPTPQHKLALAYRNLPIEELRISGFDSLLY